MSKKNKSGRVPVLKTPGQRAREAQQASANERVSTALASVELAESTKLPPNAAEMIRADALAPRDAVWIVTPKPNKDFTPLVTANEADVCSRFYLTKDEACDAAEKLIVEQRADYEAQKTAGLWIATGEVSFNSWQQIGARATFEARELYMAKDTDAEGLDHRQMLASKAVSRAVVVKGKKAAGSVPANQTGPKSGSMPNIPKVTTTKVDIPRPPASRGSVTTTPAPATTPAPTEKADAPKPSPSMFKKN